jgi:hypothetical protein
MLSIIFLVIASICNALMDTITHHYSTSIFSKFNPKFWNGETSWRNKYIDGDPSKGRKKWFYGELNVPVQVTDAWHLSKTIMIIAICSSIIVYDPGFWWWADLIIYGIAWNSTFSLFYNRIFKR